MTDAETLAAAGELWKLVRLVKLWITPDGTVVANHKELAAMRAVADECDPWE